MAQFHKQKKLELEKQNEKKIGGLYHQLEKEMVYQDKKMSSLQAVDRARNLSKQLDKQERPEIIPRKESTQSKNTVVMQKDDTISENSSEDSQK